MSERRPYGRETEQVAHVAEVRRDVLLREMCAEVLACDQSSCEALPPVEYRSLIKVIREVHLQRDVSEKRMIENNQQKKRTTDDGWTPQNLITSTPSRVHDGK